MKTSRRYPGHAVLFGLVLLFAMGVMGTYLSGDAAAQARPAYTANVDDPARVPYQGSVRQWCFLADPACDFTFPAVPAGKRLVVTHASGYFSSRETASSQFIFVSVRRGGNDDIFLPTSYQGCGPGSPVPCPNSIFVFNQAVQEVYSAGETPVVRIATGDRGYPLVGSVSNSPLPANNTVTLSGYLVDCTAAACQPIAP